MKLNEEKSIKMVFSKSNTEFATRITMNENTLDRLVGVWVTTNQDWEKNTREVCKKPLQD